MGVRLNKVLTELNIGLQTAVDYLKKKNLGEINDATMNTKITDEQYNALVKEFKGDKDVKTQAGMMFPKKEKKAKPEHKSEPVVAKTKEEVKQTFTPLGKIDLSTVGKPNKPQEEKHETAFKTEVFSDTPEPVHTKTTPVGGGKKHDADEFDLSDISAKEPPSREDIIAAAEEAAFNESAENK